MSVIAKKMRGTTAQLNYNKITTLGSAPTLTSDDVLVFWQKDTTVYGQYVGSVV